MRIVARWPLRGVDVGEKPSLHHLRSGVADVRHRLERFHFYAAQHGAAPTVTCRAPARPSLHRLKRQLFTSKPQDFCDHSGDMMAGLAAYRKKRLADRRRRRADAWRVPHGWLVHWSNERCVSTTGIPPQSICGAGSSVGGSSEDLRRAL